MPLFESAEIESMHLLLNSKEFAPSRGYRRNVRVYPLVCYVNNITGCYLSKNADPIPIFIGRARVLIDEISGIEEWSAYSEMVSKYLDEIEHHLQAHGIDRKYL